MAQNQIIQAVIEIEELEQGITVYIIHGIIA
jgi:hypothetical protein